MINYLSYGRHYSGLLDSKFLMVPLIAFVAVLVLSSIGYGNGLTGFIGGVPGVCVEDSSQKIGAPHLLGAPY